MVQPDRRDEAPPVIELDGGIRVNSARTRADRRAAYARMASDSHYQEVVRDLMQEFDAADRETVRHLTDSEDAPLPVGGEA